MRRHPYREPLIRSHERHVQFQCRDTSGYRLPGRFRNGQPLIRERYTAVGFTPVDRRQYLYRIKKAVSLLFQ